MKTMNRAPISINIHDSHFGIWQDNAQDSTFNQEVFQPILKSFQKRGWRVTADPQVYKHRRRISKSYRIAAKGELRAEIKICGRCIELEFWSEAATPGTNSNGPRYEFDKLKRMPYLDRQRTRLEFRRLLAWLEKLASVSVSYRDNTGLSPMERIQKDYAESWHTVKELGRPTWSGDYNRKSADGHLLEHGQTVWFRGDCGRYLRGTAYYNINNMWWVIAGGSLRNKSSYDLYANQPADLRSKVQRRTRRDRLEAELRKAIANRNYRRAETLDRILFDGQPIYLIWSRKNNLYYRTNYSGYSSSKSSAGKYTRAEAEAEVRRVPHILEAHGDNGEIIKFGEAA